LKRQRRLAPAALLPAVPSGTRGTRSQDRRCFPDTSSRLARIGNSLIDRRGKPGLARRQKLGEHEEILAKRLANREPAPKSMSITASGTEWIWLEQRVRTSQACHPTSVSGSFSDLLGLAILVHNPIRLPDDYLGVVPGSAPLVR
jgi:hypothetical protein